MFFEIFMFIMAVYMLRRAGIYETHLYKCILSSSLHNKTSNVHVIFTWLKQSQILASNADNESIRKENGKDFEAYSLLP